MSAAGGVPSLATSFFLVRPVAEAVQFMTKAAAAYHLPVMYLYFRISRSDIPRLTSSDSVLLVDPPRGISSAAGAVEEEAPADSERMSEEATPYFFLGKAGWRKALSTLSRRVGCPNMYSSHQTYSRQNETTAVVKIASRSYRPWTAPLVAPAARGKGQRCCGTRGGLNSGEAAAAGRVSSSREGACTNKC